MGRKRSRLKIKEMGNQKYKVPEQERTVPVPGSGEPNIQRARTERFRYPSVIV